MTQTASQVWLLRFARKACVLVLIIGGLSLAGWVFAMQSLKSWGPNFVSMNPLTAILFILSGGSILYAILPARGERRFRPNSVIIACGILLVLCGLAKLLDYASGWSLPFDQWLFHRTVLEPGPYGSNQIAPNTALNLLLCGLGFVLFDLETRRGFRPAQVFFFLATLVALFGLVGYAYRVLPLYEFASTIPMPLNSAVAFELLGLAAFGARPDRGLMSVITSDTTGGAIARRLLPAAIVIPLGLGALRFVGERRGYFETEIGISLFAVSTMMTFALLIWWNAKLLFVAECQRQRAEKRLAVQYSVTEVLAESPTIEEARSRILKALCSSLDCVAGAAWRLDERAAKLHCVEMHGADGGTAEFAQNMLGKGEDLPGQAWEREEPVWVRDLAVDHSFPQSADAARAGWHAAFGFPVRVNGMTCGVMEFFQSEPREPDLELMQVLDAVGSQMGQFLERKRAEEQLQRASAELARSNTELQQFAYVASHDLTEPLRMIVSYLELLEAHAGGRLDAQAKEFVGYAEDGARRMQALISDLLAYARVGTRAHDLKPESCEKILDAALTNLRVAIAEARAEIIRDPLPVVLADSVQLTQVFQNLIGNALKFRGQATPRIEIGVEQKGADWLFRVKDNGIGIDPKSFERIFVLFQRLHTRQEYPGTGMGLSICKKIIERHGGRIWVESEPGKGTVFFFTLPVHSETAPEGQKE